MRKLRFIRWSMLFAYTLFFLAACDNHLEEQNPLDHPRSKMFAIPESDLLASEVEIEQYIYDHYVTNRFKDQALRRARNWRDYDNAERRLREMMGIDATGKPSGNRRSFNEREAREISSLYKRLGRRLITEDTLLIASMAALIQKDPIYAGKTPEEISEEMGRRASGKVKRLVLIPRNPTRGARLDLFNEKKNDHFSPGVNSFCDEFGLMECIDLAAQSHAATTRTLIVTLSVCLTGCALTPPPIQEVCLIGCGTTHLYEGIENDQQYWYNVNQCYLAYCPDQYPPSGMGGGGGPGDNGPPPSGGGVPCYDLIIDGVYAGYCCGDECGFLCSYPLVDCE